MGNLSLRERKIRQRWQPLQHTSGNIGTPRSNRLKQYSRNDWEPLHDQQDACSQNIGSYVSFPSQVSIHQNCDASFSDNSITNGSPDILRTINRIFRGDAYHKYETRKNREKCKKTGLDLWSPRAETLFKIFILIIPPYGKSQIPCRLINETETPSMGRNELIAYLLQRHNAPVEYQRKNISSHIQVIAKPLIKDNNIEAQKLLITDIELVRLLKPKEMWFDEATLTLCEGKGIRNMATVSSMSGLMPNIQSLFHQNGRQRRLVQSVELLMGIYQKSVPHQLFHTCTALQTPGGAPAKSITDVMPSMDLFPQLGHILENEDSCEFLWFESSFSTVEELPGIALNFAIDFDIIVQPDEQYTDWKVTTSIYHHRGQVSQEFCRDLKIDVGEGSRIKLKEISLLSQWWVRLLSTMVQKRQQAGIEYQTQLESLQHENCACAECLVLQAGHTKATVAEDENWHKYFRDLSIMQSIHAVPKEGGNHRRVAVFLFKFRRTRGEETPLTTWHHLIRPEAERMDFSYASDSITDLEEVLKQDLVPLQMQHSNQHQVDQSILQHSTRQWACSNAMSNFSSLCEYPAHNATPTDSTSSIQSNASLLSYGQESNSSTGIAQSVGNESNSGQRYQDLRRVQRQPMHDHSTVYLMSQQGIEHGSDYSHMPLSCEDVDLTHLQMDDFSFVGLNEADLLAVENSFSFNQPLAITSHTSDLHLDEAEQSSISSEQANLSSHMYAPQPRRVIPAARLSSPIVMLGPDRGRNTYNNDICILPSQDIGIERAEELCADRQYFIGLEDQDYVGHTSLDQRDCSNVQAPKSSHGFSEAATQGRISLSDGQRYGFESSQSQQSNLDLQHRPSIHTSTQHQLSILPSTYEYASHGSFKAERVSEVPSDPYDLVPSQEPQIQHIYEPHSATLPSQHVTTPLQTSRSEPTAQTQPIDLALLPGWNTNAPLESHTWFLDLAIACTEDMIEQARAAEMASLASMATAVKLETVAAVSQDTMLQHSEDEEDPVGRVLGEIETMSEGWCVGMDKEEMTQAFQGSDCERDASDSTTNDGPRNLSHFSIRPTSAPVLPEDQADSLREAHEDFRAAGGSNLFSENQPIIQNRSLDPAVHIKQPFHEQFPLQHSKVQPELATREVFDVSPAEQCNNRTEHEVSNNSKTASQTSLAPQSFDPTFPEMVKPDAYPAASDKGSPAVSHASLQEENTYESRDNSHPASGFEQQQDVNGDIYPTANHDEVIKRPSPEIEMGDCKDEDCDRQAVIKTEGYEYKQPGTPHALSSEMLADIPERVMDDAEC